MSHPPQPREPEIEAARAHQTTDLNRSQALMNGDGTALALGRAMADRTTLLAAYDRLTASIAEGRKRALEEAAKVAEHVKGGFSAVFRLKDDTCPHCGRGEPELDRDEDGPWVLNSDIAKALRALKDKAPTT